MNYYVIVAINLCILIPAAVGWFRMRSVDKVFYPFIYFIWGGAFAEALSVVIVLMGHYNIIPFNLWLLVGSLLMLFQFRQWRVISSKETYRILQGLMVAFWLYELIVFSKFNKGFNDYFFIFYSFVAVLLSISMINSLLMKEKGDLLVNPIFIICCCFVVFFTSSIISETFLVYGLKLGGEFKRNMHRILVFTNLLCNLVYAVAILKMPKKQAFSLQY